MAALSLKDLKAQTTKAHQAGDHATAATGYAAYLTHRPDDGSMWSNLGVLHRSQSRHDMALRCHRRAYALQPNDQGTRNNLANTLSDTGQYAESLTLRRGLLADTPNDPNQLAMIGRCLRGMGDYAGAIEHLEPATQTLPDDAELQMQLAFAQLGNKDYAKGFETYKARWRAGELQARSLPFPEWKGEDLKDKSIVVLPEQGFGDAVLFMRFLPAIREIGADVRLLVEPPLRRLFAHLEGVTIVTADDLKTGHPDYWINMMDLAGLHFQRSSDVPGPAKLHIPEDSRVRASEIVAPYKDQFKIGVVWSGSATYKGNAFRSFSHTDFMPLVDIPGVQLFSLYKGPYLDAFNADGSNAFIIDTASSDRDFADCAATMEAMDLIITSDTVSAHIGGSLGIDVWTVLHWDPFWVWRHTGDETPWYPGMRLFRQTQPRDWTSAMEQVEAALMSRLDG